MPKHVIEFNLPEEKDELKTTQRAGDYHSALWEVSQDLMRKMTKYGTHPTEDRQLTEKEQELAEAIRERFYQILNEQGIADDF